MRIRRGDVFWIHIGPTVGAEIRKNRPAVVVSNNVANEFSLVVTVLPISASQLSKTYPAEVLLSGVSGLKNSKAKANQIRTIDKRRLGQKMGKLSQSLMKQIDSALRLHLDLQS